MKEMNKDYRDTYHFSNGYRKIVPDESTSVAHDPAINTKINDNPYRQNVEIEKEEVVLRPDMSALHKAGGKKHSQGGTGVYLPEDSFVFSADKSLAVTKEEQKLFELRDKDQKNYKKKDNTPAKVLERNVDLEHYNRMMTILEDPTKDKLAKDTAMLMFEKYLKTIGNIAFIQESKKDFPDGVPAISEGSAPVYDVTLKNDIMENKQYMKYGGAVSNPYKMQAGGPKKTIIDSVMVQGPNGWKLMSQEDFEKQELANKKLYDDAFRPWLKTVQPAPTPFTAPVAGGTGRAAGMAQAMKMGREQQEIQSQMQNAVGATGNTAKITGSAPGFKGNTRNPYKTAGSGNPRIDQFTGKFPPYPNEFVGYYDRNQKKEYYAPEGITPEKFYGTPGLIEYMKTLDVLKGVDNDLKKPDDGVWGYRHQLAYDKFFGEQPVVPTTTPNDYTSVTETTTVAKMVDKINPGEVTGDPQNGIPVNWKFTPWQKQSQLYNAMKWAGVDREMPIRSRYRATYADPMLLNPEQSIADAKAVAYQQMEGANLYSPIMSQAQKASAYGQVLNQIPGIRSQYDNQNAGITNQFRQYNNQVKNDETLKNVAFDQQYWRESAIGRQNFKNMRTFMADQFMNNRMQDVQDNQSLAYNMLRLGPKPAYGFDWDTGNFLRNDKNILDVQGGTSGETAEAMAKQVMDWKNQGLSDSVIAAMIKTKAFSQMAPYMGGAPTFGQMMKKKGGYTKNPYRK